MNTNLDRAADEYLTADTLSHLGFGPMDKIQARLSGIPDYMLADVISWCQSPPEDIEYPEDFEGDYIDWIYEQEREKLAGLEDYMEQMEKYYREDSDPPLTDYEKRVNRGAYG